MPRPTPRATALAAVAAAAVLFGTSGVARGLGPDGLSSVVVGSWRAVIGGVALVIAATAAGQAPWTFPARPGWTALGGLAVIGYQLAFFAAADRVGVGPAAVVSIGTGPVVAGAIDRLGFGNDVSRRWAAGVVVALAGIVALSTGSSTGGSALGWGFAIAAGCCYPVYGLAAQRLMADGPALGAIATVFGAGAVITAPIAVAATATSGLGPVGVDVVALLAYLGLAATALAYALWAVGLRRLSLSDTVAVTLAEPAAAVLLAALLIDEPLGVRSGVAMVVVIAGVVIATTGARSEPAPAPATQ